MHINARKRSLSQQQRLAAAFPIISKANLEKELRGDDALVDFDAPSLQNRLLEYFEARLNFKEAKAFLQSAEQKRIALLRKTAREARLGLHPDNKELSKLVEGFDDYDLWLLNSVVNSIPAIKLMSQELQQLFSRKMGEGLGENLVLYLAARIKLQKTRMARENRSKMREVFNPHETVVSRLWTDPNLPLWLIPSIGASKIVSELADKPITRNAYNALIGELKLPRLPQEQSNPFFSSNLADPEGISLRQELEKVAKTSLIQARKGRPSGIKKRPAFRKDRKS